MRAYHFVGQTLRDGRPIPADGEWLEHVGPVVMCKSGLHASVHPFDALQYATGNTLCLVDIESAPASEFVQGTDKVVGNRRRIVARIDAEPLLRAFARSQALSVLHLWDAPEVVRHFLTTGDEALRAAAWAAAWAAARAAAGAAAGAAGWAAAGAAAGATAWAAAGDAAGAAAWAAARDAAGAAAWAAARAAAWAATGAAAWAAARAAAREQFAALVDAAFSGVVGS